MTFAKEISTTPSEWHTIRPWAPQISLVIREITSVSATFILSSSFDARDSRDGTLTDLGLFSKALGSESSDSDDDTGREESPRSAIAAALAKGLSVTVNGSPWRKVLIRINDANGKTSDLERHCDTDEAVVIIYGLVPGRQYDVDLALVEGGGTRRKVITKEEAPESAAEELKPTEPEVATPSALTPSASPPTAHGGLPSSTQVLTQINGERQHLIALIKTTKKEASKSDATLKSNIDTIKKAAEKAAAGEARTRQKILALQETIKRTQSLAAELDAERIEIEAQMEDLRQQRVDKEEEHDNVAQRHQAIRKKREEVESTTKRTLEGARNEITALGSRLDRLNARREKFEGAPEDQTNGTEASKGTIRELEDELEEVRAEVSRLRAEEQQWSPQIDEVDPSPRLTEQLPQSFFQRRRSNTSSPSLSHAQLNSLGPIGRPSLIQRTAASGTRQPWPSSSDSVNQEPSAITTSASLPQTSPKGLSVGAAPFQPMRTFTKSFPASETSPWTNL